MAITIGSITANRTTVNDNAPTVAVPSGASVGDLFVLVWHFIGSATVTWPAGFTDVGVTAYDANVSQYSKAAIRVCDGSETGSFTGSTPQYERWETRCIVVKGASATPDAKSANATYQYSSTADFSGASITTTGASRTILFIAGTEAGGTATATGTAVPPSGFTTDESVDRGNGTFTMIAHGAQASAGAATYVGSATFGAVADSRGSAIIVLAFTLSGGNSFSGSVTESLTMADTGIGVSSFQAASSQGITATDSTAASNSSSGTAVETGSVADTQTGAQGVSGAASESASLSDAQTGSAGVAGTAAESLAAAETLSPSMTASSAAAESLSASDAGTASSSASASVSEAFSIAEVAMVSQAAIVAAAESVAVVDGLAGSWSTSAAIAESLTVSAAFSTNTEVLASMSEALILADSASASAALFASISEANTLADQASAMSAFGALCIEAVSVVEALNAQMDASVTVAELLSVVDAPGVIASMTAAIVESGSLTDAIAAFLGGISIGADSPAFWIVPRRLNFIRLPPRHMFTKYSVKPLKKRSLETITVDVDASAYLGDGVAISAVVSTTVEPVTDVPLEVSSVQCNTRAIVINGNTVDAGKALQMVISGGKAGADHGARGYLVRVLCDTDRGSDVSEVLVPVQVDDYPYIT